MIARIEVLNMRKFTELLYYSKALQRAVDNGSVEVYTKENGNGTNGNAEQNNPATQPVKN